MTEQRLSAALFEPLVGKAFRVELKDGAVELILRSVTPLPPPRHRASGGEEIVIDETRARKDPFTLLFGGASHLLPQGTYPMTSESLRDRIEIFIVPIGRDSEGFIYQAVFG
jgi:hypothetical protein